MKQSNLSRFESGTIFFNDQRKVDLKEWTLAVRAAIGDMTVSPGKTSDTPVQKAKARQLWDETKLVYDTSKVEGLVAGDYSLQRLFTNITSK